MVVGQIVHGVAPVSADAAALVPVGEGLTFDEAEGFLQGQAQVQVPVFNDGQLGVVPADGTDVRAAVKIPIFAAGGVLTGQDIADLHKMGADGVQLGSRFAACVESNAAPSLKQYYLKSKKDDIVIIHSPVGLPGRAVRTPFSKRIMDGPVPPTVCDRCLKQCDHHFCIIRALSRAQQGDLETGLVFTGEFMPRIDRILTVHEIYEELKQQLEEAN